MPQLGRPRSEQMAQLVARGVSIRQAYIDAGYKGNRENAWRVGATEKFRVRVAELVAEDREKTSDVTVHHRKWIDGEMRKLYDRCIQAVPVYSKRKLEGNEPGKECSECGNRTGMWLFNPKEAVKLLEMFGLEQGMFKRHLDVTSRKVTMIEGSQKEILEKFAQLLEKLGIPAIAQLCDRLGHDTIVAAMKLIGYTVSKENGKDVKRLDTASGDVGDAGDSGEPDAQPLRPAPEAARLS